MMDCRRQRAPRRLGLRLGAALALGALGACSGGGAEEADAGGTDSGVVDATSVDTSLPDAGDFDVRRPDVGCVPREPTCGGTDDDCDGEIDELAPVDDGPAHRTTVEGLADSSSSDFPSFVQAIPTDRGFCAIAHDEADGELHYLLLSAEDEPIQRTESVSIGGPEREIMDLAWDGTSCAMIFRTGGELYMRRWEPGVDLWDLGQVSEGEYGADGSADQLDAAVGVAPDDSSWIIVHDSSTEQPATARRLPLAATEPGTTHIDGFPELHGIEDIAQASIGPVPASPDDHAIALATAGASPDRVHVLTSTATGYVARPGLQIELGFRQKRAELLGWRDRVLMLAQHDVYDVLPSLTYGASGSFSPASTPDKTWYNRYRAWAGPKDGLFVIDWEGDELLRLTAAGDVYELVPLDHPGFASASTSGDRDQLLSARLEGDRLRVLSVEPAEDGSGTAFDISELGCF